MKTAESILKPYLTKVHGENVVTEAMAIKAMKEYAKQEYERGIKDGKEIQEHGTTMWQD